MLSRIVGLIRERVFAHYFGNSDAADAFRAAIRIPNFLQNLFGEGVLSASFIPVYARLSAEGRRAEASELAEAVFAILVLITAVLTTVGIFVTPWLIDAIAPGFQGDKRLLTIHLVQILFPGAAVLVLSAWCLGILNSHRRFFLSYAAPVLWNLAIIAGLLWKGGETEQSHLAVIISFCSVLGSGLQFLIQLPTVLRLLWPLRLKIPKALGHVHIVGRNFFPVFLSRGVVQVSAYIDSWLASFLGTGAVSALGYAQTIYTLPVSLFGMAVSAAELPAMSSELGTDSEISTVLRQRLERGLQQIAFFVIPSAVAFILLGDIVVSTIYRTRSGNFQMSDVIFVWAVLAGSAVGLLASTSGRLYSSAFYALRNTRTPLKFAVLRVSLTLGLGYFCALPLPRMLHIDPHWGVSGLTLSAGIAGWIEFALLRHSLQKRIGLVPHSIRRNLTLWFMAGLSAAIGFLVKNLLPFHARPLLSGICVLALYGVIYLSLTQWMGVAPANVVSRILRRRG
jgi:putative peptidoglycan lipid II flippase